MRCCSSRVSKYRGAAPHIGVPPPLWPYNPYSYPPPTALKPNSVDLSTPRIAQPLHEPVTPLPAHIAQHWISSFRDQPTNCQPPHPEEQYPYAEPQETSSSSSS